MEVEILEKNDQIEEQFTVLKKAAFLLNQRRVKMLPDLQKNIEGHLANLGMPFAQFMIEFQPQDNFHDFGNTSVSFLFSANKGSPLLELSKVASGGELSRLMLVLKYISARISDLDTLVFNEIDTGVSGEIASLMGAMMQEMSQNNQLIAISHLPQIASKGDFHLKVIKSVVGEKTVSDVISLSYDQRVDEIARLLSGHEVSAEAFENAKVLLNQ